MLRLANTITYFMSITLVIVFDPEPFGSELKADLLRPKGSLST